MAYRTLGEVTAPFALTPTELENHISETKKAIFTGIGMAFGLSIGGAVIYFLGEMMRK